METKAYSVDKRLDHLLDTVVREVRLYAENQISQIKRLTQIGIALSAEKDVNSLLDIIVEESRKITGADGGSLYIIDHTAKILNFAILQNDTLKTKCGGTSGIPIRLPPIPLEHDGRPNYANVSSYVALTGQIVNIPDVYESELFDFTGPRTYDISTGYRSRSMLVMPLKNHENDIIGVLQLLNALDPETRATIPFSDEYVELIASLASQAAVALTNAQLIRDLQELFYSFIKSIATAIDAKSPYTGGHVRRVVDLTLMLAGGINETHDGPFADVHFSADEVEELRLAAWMHDVGKITTPEHVIDKSTKLETIFDRIGHIETRFDLIGQAIENGYLREKLELHASNPTDRAHLDHLDRELAAELELLREEKLFIIACNKPGEFLPPEKVARLNEIAGKSYALNGEFYPYLRPDEVYHLSVLKGNLTTEERSLIENHAEMTMKILNELPFPKKYARVPEFAGSHHEKLDGSGYPRGLKGDSLSLQARIMAIADVFEALTAKDRPYKAPMRLSQAIKILQFMTKDNHIDPDLYRLLLEKKLHRAYAERELNPEQIDEE